MKRSSTIFYNLSILSRLKLVAVIATFTLLSVKSNAQCATCHDGLHDPDTTKKETKKRVPHAGSGTLGVAYLNENICGLNYVSGSTLVETRSQASGTNTNGTGLPTTVTIPNSMPSTCFKVLNAYLVWDASYTSGPANPASLSITNPLGGNFTYSVPVAGTSIPKCWGEVGTVCYYGDVSTCVSGPGTYTVNISGAGNSGSEVDGVTLFIIYQDLSATYSGSLAFYDGEITTTSTDISYTASGFNVCNTTSNAQAFALQADMQCNTNSCVNSNTYNGTSATFPNNFWNYNSVNTTVTAGQTTAGYSTYTNNSNADCYSLLFCGLYWQNTNCTTCNPVLPNVNVSPASASTCPSAGVTLTASGATTYSWQPGSLTGASVVVSPAVTTTYTVTGADVNGCTGAPVTVVVTVANGPTGVSASSNSPVCQGATLNLNGSATGATSWGWAGPNSFSSSSQNPTIPAVTAAASGTYTLTATNACGSATSTVNVTINPLPSAVTATSNSPVCAGSTLNLNGSATGATTWGWTGPNTFSSSSQNPTIPAVTGAASGTYTLTATNACGSSTNTVAVTVNPLPSITISPASPGICPGGNITLTAGGGVSYVWSTTATTSSINVSPASNTTYTVTGTDANGCTNTQTVTVTVGAITVTANASSSTICSGNSTTLTGGGAATYVWNTGSTNSVTSVSPTSATTYTVTGTSGAGCMGTATVAINVNPTPTISVTSISSSVCNGDTTSAGAVITGGTGPFTYSWSNGETTATDTGLTSGSYTVNITDVNGCASNSGSVTIGVVTITVTATSSAVGNTICMGNSAVLTGAGATTYSWAPGPVSGVNDTVNPMATTTYTVTGTTGNCNSTATIVITVDSLPTGIAISSSVPSDTICSGGSGVTLTASGASTYTWQPGSLSGPSVNVNPLVTTRYTVTGTNSSGCSDTVSITINVSSTPTVTVSMSSANDTICSGQSVTLTANGAAGSYSWSNGATTSSITVSPTSPIVYSVTASNGPCAQASVNQPVNIYPPLTLTMTGDSACSGNNGTVSVNATGGGSNYTYKWSNGTTGVNAITVPASGVYYVCTVTDACGDNVMDSAQVVTVLSPVAAFTPTPNPIPGGEYVSFIDNSTNASTWFWSFGDGGTSTVSFPYHQYDTAGDYIVYLLVASKNGCLDSARDTVHVIETIYIPNIFTPNGDGKNDVFHVTAVSMKTYSIEIFNRWGQRVFESDSPNTDWDGRSSGGVEESDGTYYYIILASDYAGKNYKFDGYLQLIR